LLPPVPMYTTSFLPNRVPSCMSIH
jgi:hypothetical protein